MIDIVVSFVLVTQNISIEFTMHGITFMPLNKFSSMDRVIIILLGCHPLNRNWRSKGDFP